MMGLTIEAGIVRHNISDLHEIMIYIRNCVHGYSFVYDMFITTIVGIIAYIGDNAIFYPINLNSTIVFQFVNLVL